MSMLVWSSILVCIKVWVCVSLISPRVWDMRISGDLWPGVHSECEDSRTGQGLPANQSAPVQPVASNTLTLTLNCIHASLWVVQCESGTVQHRCSSRHHAHTHTLLNWRVRADAAADGGRTIACTTRAEYFVTKWLCYKCLYEYLTNCRQRPQLDTTVL